jgi:hypothetical protein
MKPTGVVREKGGPSWEIQADASIRTDTAVPPSANEHKNLCKPSDIPDIVHVFADHPLVKLVSVPGWRRRVDGRSEEILTITFDKPTDAYGNILGPEVQTTITLRDFHAAQTWATEMQGLETAGQAHLPNLDHVNTQIELINMHLPGNHYPVNAPQKAA